MIVIDFLLIYSNIRFSCAFNVNLIFTLQQNFHSDVIFVENQPGNENLIKRLLKNQESKPEAFIASFDLDECYFNKLTAEPTFSRYKNQLVIFDGKSNLIERLIKVQETDINLISRFIWVSFMKNKNETQKLNLLNIPYDSKFFLVEKIDFDIYEVTEVYQISPGTFKIYSLYGVWKNKEWKLLKKNIFWDRTDLQGHALRAGNTNKPNSGLYNLTYVEWNLMSAAMNFTSLSIQINITKDIDREVEVCNGLCSGKIDVGTNWISVSSLKLNSYDFIFPTVVYNMRLFVEVKQVLKWKAFIKPFKTDVWICVFIWVVLFYFINCITSRITGILFGDRSEDIIFNCIRALCSQGGNMSKSRLSLYIFILMPYILGIVLLQHYSADLLAKLTTDDSSLPFTDLNGVLNDGTYKIACPYPSTLWQQLNNDTGNNAKKRLELLIPISLARLQYDDLFEDICTNRWVLIYGISVSHMNAHCNVKELPQRIGVVNVGWILKKRFPYRKAMMKLLRHFQGVGLTKLYYRRLISKHQEEDYSQQPLGLETIFPAFLLFIIALCLSIFVLLFEIILWRFKMKRYNMRRWAIKKRGNLLNNWQYHD